MVPLFTLVRDGFEEIVVHGEIAVVHGNELIFHTGDLMGSYPPRSLLKPFQFLADDLPVEERWAPAVGSVVATAAQARKLREWFADPELTRHCAFPPTYPFDEAHRVLLKEAMQPPELVYHQCFANHLAILEGCRRRGWPLDTYHLTSHPYHEHLLATVGKVLGEPLGGIVAVTDGCRIPSPVLTLSTIAKLYQRLATADGKLGEIAELMRRFPEWIAGPGRVDTSIMEKNGGRAVAKVGADGLIGVGVAPDENYPHGLGIAVKIAAGYLPHYFALALSPILQELGLIGFEVPTPGHELRYHFTPFEKADNPWIDLSPTLEEGVAVWPGDREFRRIPSYALDGHHYALSHIETTVHVGTHTDAPNHFAKGTPGIDRVDVAKYLGACQIIEVNGRRGARITPADLEGSRIVATRVLFKTGTAPDPKVFNTDFMALSAELVQYLAARGVVLVGIDTPSIDLAESQELPAHHATVKANMAILEGVVLDSVMPGVYEMAAVPLKIKDGDASPVRVVVRRV